jgi:hypothetical protein
MTTPIQTDSHAQIRALYAALIDKEERFHEFKRALALYDLSDTSTDQESPEAAALRARLNEKIQTWVRVPFSGISAQQMLHWRAIVVDERFNVSLSPWKESNSY